MTRHQHSSGPPQVFTIAGSDCGGGAGIQADLATFAAGIAHVQHALAAGYRPGRGALQILDHHFAGR